MMKSGKEGAEDTINQAGQTKRQIHDKSRNIIDTQS